MQSISPPLKARVIPFLVMCVGWLRFITPGGSLQYCLHQQRQPTRGTLFRLLNNIFVVTRYQIGEHDMKARAL
jgi:hypothetical protein